MESKNRKNIILITGASSGIGREFASQLDLLMYNTDEIWLVARRQERMQELAKLLEHPCRIVVMDVADNAEQLAFKRLLEKENPKIKMLINCAGFGLMGKFESVAIDEQLAMLDINCRALTELTYHCIPYMIKNSRIIQLASSAAFLPQKGFAVYAATKSYVLSFSRALREELREKKIWVTAVCPGPVETEFFDIAEKYGETLAIKKLTLTTSDKVVKEALLDSYDRRAVSVCSFPIKAFRVMAKYVPHTVILKGLNLIK